MPSLTICIKWFNGYQHPKQNMNLIRIKIQIEMLQNQVTINIANCNTAVICINVIIKRVL